MPDSLHSEILVPPSSLVTRLLVGAAVCGAAGAAVAMFQSPRITRTTTTLAPLTVFEAPAVPVASVVALESPPPANPSEIMLVFHAGGRTYMKLADGADVDVKTRKPVLHGEDSASPYAAIAGVTTADLPVDYRVWSGQRVRIDRDCEADVVGFAMVSRLTGSTTYASLPDDTDWTAQNVMAHGARVLAAELSGCAGTYARGASLAPVVVPDELSNAPYEAEARKRLLASELSAAVQQQVHEVGSDGVWHRSGDTRVITKVLHHPLTHTQWVWAHARREDGCGGVNANLFALFRVGADGTLIETELRDLGTMTSIDQVIDIEGDGSLELVGKDWLGIDHLIKRVDGEDLSTLRVEFYGCAC